MNLVDSSGWIAYLRGGVHARSFAPAIENAGALLVPTVCLADVYRRVLRHLGRAEALRIAVAMQQGLVVDLNGAVAMLAAELGAEHGLSLADSVVLATARAYGATLWTLDATLASVGGVERRAAPGQP